MVSSLHLVKQNYSNLRCSKQIKMKKIINSSEKLIILEKSNKNQKKIPIHKTVYMTYSHLENFQYIENT